MPARDRVPLGNLPAELSSFVGRRRELDEGRRLLADARLVMLTGVGGTGKTRLALRLAAQVRRAFPDGVWFVDLTGLADPGWLIRAAEDPDALASLLLPALGLHERAGVPPVRQLTDQLADRQVLLLLDNCEHVLPACAVLTARLLAACPRLRVLATARERLAVAGEVVLAVPPLPTPEPDAPLRTAEVARYGSVALFVARAGAVVPGFALTEGNQDAVARICHALDGLPLGIELAAARVPTLSPQQILDRLVDRFTLLSRGVRGAPDRQRTLRACVEWSFDLCTKPERLLWARSSVFTGGFELDAAEGVCADDALPAEDVLDVVAGLVDKSILIREGARYRMLETVREFGAEQLREAGADEQLRDRHRDWYQRLTDRAVAEWVTVRQLSWTARLTREHPNLRAAIEDGLTRPGQAEAALRLTAGVPLAYWFSRGLFSEARRWLDDALAKTATPSAWRARALVLDAQLTATQGDRAAATRLVERGEELARRLDAPVELAYAGFVRGVVATFSDDLPAAVEAFEHMGTVLSTAPDPGSMPALEMRLSMLIGLGTVAGLTGDHDRADACFQEILAITEPLGEYHQRSYTLWVRGLTAWRRGRVDDAVASLTACLRLIRTSGSTGMYNAAQCLEGLAWAAADRQRYPRAATLLGATAALRAMSGTPLAAFGHLVADHDACERQTRAALGEAAFTAAFDRGRALPYDDAIGYALGDQRGPAPPRPAARPAPLTRREREVAELLARGLSNREIAQALVISQRTAESHVEHILAKLGLTSRAQAAAWAAEQDG